MTAIEILALPVSNDTRKAIRACTDLPMLEEALRLEEAKPGQVGDKGGPRASMIGILKLRIDLLRAEAPAAPVAPAAEPQAPAAPAVVEPAPAPVLEATPVAAPAEAAQANPAQDCASTFMLALRDGDTRLLAMLVGVVRDRDYTAEQVAEALVGAYKAQAPASTRTTRRVAPAADGAAPSPSDRNVARIKAAIEGAQVVDGAVVLTVADMDRAGFPPSWQKHATLWSSTGPAALASRGAGYTPKFRTVDGGVRVLLTPAAQ